MKYNPEEIENARTAAIQSLVKWGKKGIAYFPMRNAVNHYMEVAGMNTMSIDGEEGIRAHRKIAAQGLAIDCIAPLTSEQLDKVERELEFIANDISRQASPPAFTIAYKPSSATKVQCFFCGGLQRFPFF